LYRFSEFTPELAHEKLWSASPLILTPEFLPWQNCLPTPDKVILHVRCGKL